ncbi:MAG: zeta toxin family protein [Gammaproteobacteria bacterium]|nr:zeta toxin family protein [Gammaproteobacteria bacterium]MDH3857455.1 zeta toxin family protein [Gammaproteobacteria bacterium]
MKNQESHSAWNPGIESEIPPAYRELETIYNSANVFTTLAEVNELVAETGLSPEELISFRPHRLVLHELIVRITADIVVLEGEYEEDLGINFRTIARKIFSKYVIPNLMQIEHGFETMWTRIEDITQLELERALAPQTPTVSAKSSFWSRLRGASPKRPAAAPQSRQEREFELINSYKQRGLNADDKFSRAVYRSLYRVLGSIATTRGFVGNDPDYLKNICVRHACNYLGSREIGNKVGKLVDEAIAAEGYERIADAEKPILISLKGASAAGKSSLRPMLSQMMTDLGIEDHGYGTISPDIWRRMLLDYDALGESYKYAGRFTSHEINIIDTKLDHYIRAKADQKHSIPHLMVDRFRFDSFASEKITRVLHKTYVRYIDTMYMYFIVTPPEATVERGWERGLVRGRYKAVEDFLGHCIEAYAGMPKLLFKWLANDKPRYFFEFLDNSVAKGTYPELIARGTQGQMQIYRVRPLIDIERYQRINVLATNPEQVAASAELLEVENNLGFLRQCISKIKLIEFVDIKTDTSFLAIRSGSFDVVDDDLFRRNLADETLREIVALLAPDLLPE